jgi:arsenite/tail-anchored protein-transporting ATPase
VRVLLFTGKGGVGKTTLAAATAVRLAETGLKVLVLSSDPAHSLADALDVPLGSQPSEVDHCLFGMQLDARGLLDMQWSILRNELAALVGASALEGDGSGIVGVDSEELTVLPGVEELLALGEVRRQAESGLWDVVVLDCGPTAETLRMLTLPEAVSGYVERMWPRHRRLTYSTLGIRSGSRAGQLVDAVERLDESARSIRALLQDGARTTVRLVLTPERVVLAETRRTLTSLALHGLRVDGVLANRVMPAPDSGDGEQTGTAGPAWEWLRTRAAEQSAVLGALRADLPNESSTRMAPYQAHEPVGLAELAVLADALYGAADVLGSLHDQGTHAPEVRLESGAGLESVYVWRLPLPLVQESSVQLGRIDDDLLVTVAGERRRMALPPVLRRCDAVDAELAAGGLLVRFRPDPAVWMK